MKPTAIYNFVPLSKHVFIPDWSDKVSQDIPFKDGEDGTIEFVIKNITPLFTRNGSADRNKKEEWSAHIQQPDGKRLYYIPGTSIKGMLRSTMEILSFAKLAEDQYVDSFFGYRDFGGRQTPGGTDYIRLMGRSQPGWLSMDENGNLFLTPCVGEYERIPYAEIDQKYPGFMRDCTQEGISPWHKNTFLHDKSKEWYPRYKDYRIVCTGNIGGKNSDYLFPSERGSKLSVDDKVKQEFLSVHAPSPDFDNKKDTDNTSDSKDIKTFLRNGNELAVFFIPNKHDAEKIESIGLARYFRYPYPDSVKSIVRRTQTPSDGKDLPETIFGDIAKNNSLKGRVQVCNAWDEEPLDEDPLPLVQGVLGKPKASFYPFYLKQQSSPYKTFKNNVEIAGRKVYRSHNGEELTDLPDGNGNQDTVTRFRPVPAGRSFHCKIAVHNLRKVETGALLSALTLHKAQDAWHQIGLAKGYGYGKIKICNVRLNGLSCSLEDYLKSFEETMCRFLEMTGTSAKWRDTDYVQNLIKIHSGHDRNIMRVMNLGEYKEARKNTNFHLLNADEPHQVNFDMPEPDFQLIKRETWIEKHKEDYTCIESLRADHRYDEALTRLYQLIKSLRDAGLDTKEEEGRRVQIESEKAGWGKEQANKRRERTVEDGLAALLTEKYSQDVPKAGDYKINSYKIFKSKVEQYIKAVKNTRSGNTDSNRILTSEDVSVFNETVERLKQNHPKNEDRNWNDQNSAFHSWINETLKEYS